MITPNVTCKLEGTLYDAFQAFATRKHVKKTPEVVKELIKATPEYQVLSQLSVLENLRPSMENPEDSRVEDIGQEENQAANKEAANA